MLTHPNAEDISKPTAFARVATLLAAIGLVPASAHFPVGGLEAATGDAQAGVILALDENVGVDHEAEFFNGRTILTFTYLTGIPVQEACGDVDPDGVVLVVELPAGAQFVEARQDGNPMPPTSVSGGTLTWQLGTLDRFQHCFGTDLQVTVEADPSLADDEALQATASISTSTAGDDPADNQASIVFPAVMFPLEVMVTSAETECLDEENGRQEANDDGRGSNCGIGRAQAFSTDPPGLLGLIPASGPRPYVQSRSLSVYGYASDDDGARSASVDTRVRIENRNPFRVPLHLRYRAALYCRVRDGKGAVTAKGPIGPTAPIGSTDVECGIGNIQNMSETMFLRYDARGGLNGKCETRIALFSDERGDEVINETEPGCTLQEVGPFLDLDFELPGEADGHYGYFNGKARWCIATSANSCLVCLETCVGVSIVAQSPVDLRVTDGEGRRVGLVNDPNLGTFDAAEIPGSSYSGAGTEPQTITLALVDRGEYTLTVLGRGDGPFTITVTAESEDGTVTQGGTLAGQATTGMTLERALLIGSDGRVALEPGLDLDAVVAHLLGVAEMLDDAQLGFLDLLGNQNAGFDVGDFRAYLISIGMISSP